MEVNYPDLTEEIKGVFERGQPYPDATLVSTARPVRALRYNTGKPELNYLLSFPEALKAVAAVTTYGSEKYERFNYLKGAAASQSIDCLLRHLTAWYNGEDDDPESKLSHLAHVAWNALRLTDEMIRHPELDDRPKS